jgi:GT2 family glycosyltransferase
MTNTVVVVLAWNGERFLRPCLDALMQQDYEHPYGVVVVDNASADRSIQIVRTYPDVALIQSERNLGFAGGNNLALRAIRDGVIPAPIGFEPDAVVLLNQDTEVAPDWLTAIDHAWGRHRRAGIIGCKAYDADRTTLQHAGGVLEWPLGTGIHRGVGEPDQGQYEEDTEAEFVTGAALALRVELLRTVGLLDEGFTPAYYEDVDYCYRARAAGYAVVYVPSAHLLHHEGTSLTLRSPEHQNIYHRNRVRFLLKWRSIEQLREWADAERAEIERWSTSDSLARKQAYVHGMLALPHLLETHDAAATHAKTPERVAPLLRQLHQTVLREEARHRTAAGYLAKATEDQQP